MNTINHCMPLSDNKYNNSPSFKQINIVRVPKRAFSSPEILRACTKEFTIGLNGGKEIDYTNLANQFIKNNYIAGNKMILNLEGEENLHFSSVPLQEDSHTFCILTGKERDLCEAIISPNNLATRYMVLGMMNNICGKNIFESPKTVEDFQADVIKFISEKLQDVFSRTQIHEFKIENLGDLAELKSKLGV